MFSTILGVAFTLGVLGGIGYFLHWAYTAARAPDNTWRMAIYNGPNTNRAINGSYVLTYGPFTTKDRALVASNAEALSPGIQQQAHAGTYVVTQPKVGLLLQLFDMARREYDRTPVPRASYDQLTQAYIALLKERKPLGEVDPDDTATTADIDTLVECIHLEVLAPYHRDRVEAAVQRLVGTVARAARHAAVLRSVP